MYKRQPFQYYNELAFIVGNDKAEGNATAMTQEIGEGNIMDEAIDLDDVGDFNNQLMLIVIWMKTFLNPTNQVQVVVREYHHLHQGREREKRRAWMVRWIPFLKP